MTAILSFNGGVVVDQAEMNVMTPIAVLLKPVNRKLKPFKTTYKVYLQIIDPMISLLLHLTQPPVSFYTFKVKTIEIGNGASVING